jgi:hypothetical protein
MWWAANKSIDVGCELGNSFCDPKKCNDYKPLAEFLEELEEEVELYDDDC